LCCWQTVLEEKVPSAPQKSSMTSALCFTDARHLRDQLRNHYSYRQVMLKPRLFSTLRCLQHENPLV
jgi:hypothetical protein